MRVYMEIRDAYDRLGLDPASASATGVEASYGARRNELESGGAGSVMGTGHEEAPGRLELLEEARAVALANLAERASAKSACGVDDETDPAGADGDRTLVFAGRRGDAGTAVPKSPVTASSESSDTTDAMDTRAMPARQAPEASPARPTVRPTALYADSTTQPGYGDGRGIAPARDGGGAGGLVAGRYRLTRLVPGTVNGLEMWIARDTVTGGAVAMKSLPAASEADADARRRFVAAGRKGLAVQHAAILGVLDVGDNQGRAFVVQEAPSPGACTLRERLSGWGADVPGREGLALDVARRVGEALAEAHRAGLFHLGLGFESVWIDETGGARVADFGLNPSGPSEGAARFAAPEQSAGGAGGVGAGAAIDQFALAAMLKRLLGAGTGGPRTPPPAAVARAMARATAPDPAARFGSVEEFIAALDPTPGARSGGAARLLVAVAAATALGAAGWYGWKLAEPKVADFRARREAGKYESSPYDPAAAGKRDLTVDASGKGDMASLEEAVRQAKPGAVLTIRPGDYAGTLAPMVEMTLVGDGAAGSVRVTGPKGDAVLSATAEGTGTVTLRNLKLVRRRLESEAGDASPAVEVSGRALVMESCEIDAAGGAGIRLADSPATLAGVTVTGSRDDGISARGMGRVVLDRCAVSGAGGRGVSAAGAECSVEATSCSVERASRTGFAVSDGAAATLTGCSVTAGSEAGVACSDSGRLAMDGCRVTGQEGAEGFGVTVSGAGAVATLSGCELRGNAAGGVKIDAGATLAASDTAFGAVEGVSAGSGAGRSGNGLLAKGAGTKAALGKCRFEGNRDHGVIATEGAAVEASDSVFARNRVGLALKKSASATVIRCRFDGNREYAVEALDITRGKLDSCDFSNTPKMGPKPGGRAAGLFNVSAGASLDVANSTGDGADEPLSPPSRLAR